MRKRLGAACLLLLTHCGDDTTTGGAGGAGGTGGEGGAGAAGGDGGGGGVAAIEWTACEAFAAFPPVEGTAKLPAECATVAVPLDWSEPEGPTLDLFVKRVPATNQPAKKHLWLLNGGPGASSQEFDPYLLSWAAANPEVELYTTDFRGVGQSSLLPCTDSQINANQIDACVAAVEGEFGSIDHFTTTEAARDAAELMRRARTDNQDIFVYGVSYGTFWAHRFLQVEPDLAAGVILDSIVPPDVDWTDYSPNSDAIAQHFFELCAEDAFCSGKLGGDPWAAAQAYLDPKAALGCPTSKGLTLRFWKRVLAQALRKVESRPLVPALIYRLTRCAPEDEDAILNMISFLDMIPPEPAGTFAFGLHLQIVLSEFWPEDALSPDAYDDLDASLTIAIGGTGDYARIREEWPVTPHDEYAGATASPMSRVLLLQGGVDPQTADFAAQSFIDTLAGQGNLSLFFPLAPHATVSGTPLASDPTKNCAEEAVLEFVDDPTSGAPACMEDLAEIDFGDNPELAALVFGTGSIWENTNPKVVPRPSLARDVHRALSPRSPRRL